MWCLPTAHKHAQQLAAALFFCLYEINRLIIALQALQQHFQSPDFKAFTDKVCIVAFNPVHCTSRHSCDWKVSTASVLRNCLEAWCHCITILAGSWYCGCKLARLEAHMWAEYLDMSHLIWLHRHCVLSCFLAPYQIGILPTWDWFCRFCRHAYFQINAILMSPTRHMVFEYICKHAHSRYV